MMKKYLNKLLGLILTVTIGLCSLISCFGGDGGSSSRSDGESESASASGAESSKLPDYDKEDADKMIFNAWFTPEISEESFKAYKECGFNYMFLQGNNIGSLGGSKMMEAMELCEKLDIKVYVDVTRSEGAMLNLAERLTKYKCFMGFNYDEPVIHSSKLNGTTGIVELSPYVTALRNKYPQVEFLVNLNHTSCVSYPWGTEPFTYEEYLQALFDNILSVYADTNTRKWLSCDDYPLYKDTSAKKQYYLKADWIQGLEYLATKKRDSDMELYSNFFIQAMPYGTGAKSRDRVPSYNDLRLQIYSVMAFGYDSVSFFCYGTPPAVEGGEFTEEQVALVDRSGNKTEIWTNSQKLISEINKFSHTYMQFNDNWLGVLPLLGTNNIAKDDTYYNSSFDTLISPLSGANRLKGVKSVEATEDSIVGYMQDKNGNPGYMVVNYNDTTENKKSVVTFKFANYNKAYVYIDGIKKEVTLKNNELTLDLGVGEGVFVIPYAG